MVSVVKRPFKSGGVFYAAGSIVEPASIKLYKTKVKEGRIVEVDEHNLDTVLLDLTIKRGVKSIDAIVNAVKQPKTILATGSIVTNKGTAIIGNAPQETVVTKLAATKPTTTTTAKPATATITTPKAPTALKAPESK